MIKEINIIVDASGSMMEDDKNAVVKYLLNGICNVKKSQDFLGVEFVLYQWGEKSIKHESIEKAKVEFAGKALLDGLKMIAGSIVDTVPLILVSDGGFSSDAKTYLKKMSKRIIPIFVGNDADRAMLQAVSTDNVVYSIADFMQALSEAKNN